MLGGPENQFSVTRAALSTRGAQQQIPISIASPCFDQYRLTGNTEPTMPKVFANRAVSPTRTVEDRVLSFRTCAKRQHRAARSRFPIPTWVSRLTPLRALRP